MKSFFTRRQEVEKRSFFLDDELLDYINGHSSPPDQVQEALIEETAELGWVSRMQISVDQGNFLTMLVKSINPSFAVEIGTFTGFSSIAIARGLSENGSLLCCDVSEKWTAIAQTYWERAGLKEKIDLVLAPAMETLNNLPEDKKIDFVFIDADKGNYKNYYEAVLSRLSDHGMIVIDNVLWSGRVIDENANDDDTHAIKDFNSHVRDDDRVTCTMLSIGDGVSLIQKK
ncbi:MAG: SAM-dependent methyltransferase [Acidimicrobiaceae bacterium]|jgi:caffeoyl-CoA O-methyltransferase|nr:SAM-dependent methyltransferase [Acidimicrobiaceae bacterium]|tara:strand:+ start:83049 stop:83735 length:687 start_codon:yes stop_codon:yes gene_type:complete